MGLSVLGVDGGLLRTILSLFRVAQQSQVYLRSPSIWKITEDGAVLGTDLFLRFIPGLAVPKVCSTVYQFCEVLLKKSGLWSSKSGDNGIF